MVCAMNYMRPSKISPTTIALSDSQKDVLATAMHEAGQAARRGDTARFAVAKPAADSLPAKDEPLTLFIC